MYTIFTDAAENLSAHNTHATCSHHDGMGVVISSQFADHFSRSVALFFVQFEVYLRKIMYT